MARATKLKSTYTKAQIQDLIETDDRAVARALIAIYRRQTADVQAVGLTSEHNSRGFTAFDAEFMTEVAKRAVRRSIESPNDPELRARGWLTPGELPAVRAKVLKYWRQLIEVAEANDARRMAAMLEDSK